MQRMGPRVGDHAPDFEARSDDGRRVNLRSLRGSWVVLCFFPRAGSPGCSLEARQFERALPDFERLGARVVGVSVDTEARAALMRERCGLTFPLLPDGAQRLGRAYGVSGGLGGLLGLARRQTFLISPEGLVARHWRQVNPVGHAAEVLAALRDPARSTPRPAGS